MSEKEPTAQPPKKKPYRSWGKAERTTRKGVVIGVSLTILTYLGKASGIESGLLMWPQNAKDVSKIPVSDDERQDAVAGLKEQLKNLIIGYHARNGHFPDKEISEEPLTQVEKDYLKDRCSQIEILNQVRKSNGFYAVLLRDKQTDETILVYPGMNFAKTDSSLKEWNEMRRDSDDALWLSTGGKMSQSEDAIEFARVSEHLLRKLTGKGVSYIVAHSLGTGLALPIDAQNICPDAKCFFYDGPGMKKVMVRTCARERGISEDEVKKNLRENSYNLVIQENLLNLMGAPTGIALKTSDSHCSDWLFPEKHVMNDDFVCEVSQATDFTDHTNDGFSWSPAIALGLLALIGVEARLALGERSVRSGIDTGKKCANYVNELHRMRREARLARENGEQPSR